MPFCRSSGIHTCTKRPANAKISAANHCFLCDMTIGSGPADPRLGRVGIDRRLRLLVAAERPHRDVGRERQPRRPGRRWRARRPARGRSAPSRPFRRPRLLQAVLGLAHRGSPSEGSPFRPAFSSASWRLRSYGPTRRVPTVRASATPSPRPCSAGARRWKSRYSSTARSASATMRAPSSVCAAQRAGGRCPPGAGRPGPRHQPVDDGGDGRAAARPGGRPGPRRPRSPRPGCPAPGTGEG